MPEKRKKYDREFRQGAIRIVEEGQDHLLTPTSRRYPRNDWERWWLGTVRRAVSADYLTHHEKSGPPDGNTTQLVHASCHGNFRARQRSRNRPPATPSRLA